MCPGAVAHTCLQAMHTHTNLHILTATNSDLQRFLCQPSVSGGSAEAFEQGWELESTVSSPSCKVQAFADLCALESGVSVNPALT